MQVKLLDNPANLVLVFPQGKLYSNHLKNISFEKGVMQMIHASQKKINIIFAATFIDYFAKRKAFGLYLFTKLGERRIH